MHASQVVAAGLEAARAHRDWFLAQRL